MAADPRAAVAAWRRSLAALLAAVVALPAAALVVAVRAYRLLLKPWLGNACRFEPSCSAYTLQALQQYGATGGVLLGGWRLLRCQPWCQGGCDPVPDHHPLRGLLTRFGSDPASAAEARAAAAGESAAAVCQPADPASPRSTSRQSLP